MSAAQVIPINMPYSQESEEAVLGSILINPDAFTLISKFLSCRDFFILRHQYIWEALERIYERDGRADFITVREELKAMGRLTDVGGAGYLLQLANNTPTSSHVELYGKLVERSSIRRKLLSAADKIRSIALNEELELDKVIADSQAQVMAVSSVDKAEEEIPFSSRLNDLLESVERRANGTEEPGISTGFQQVDDIMAGFNKNDFVIFAARPGMGKTSLLLSMLLNMIKAGHPVGLCSQEMDADSITYRLAALESGINLHHLRRGKLTSGEYGKLLPAVNRIGKLPFYITDAVGMTPDQLKAKTARWQHQYGVEVVMVDYLQIMSSGGRFKADNRVAEVGWFARQLKQIARELHIPIVAAAQLSRAVEQRQDKRPVLSDLRESGEVEQEADIVAFIYREALYNDNSEFPNRADIIFAKHRNGPTGTASLHFERTTTRFMDARVTTLDLRSL